MIWRLYGKETTTQWIPGHSDIRMNDNADTLAKLGSHMQQENINTSYYETDKQIDQQNSKDVWYIAWTIDDKGVGLSVIFSSMSLYCISHVSVINQYLSLITQTCEIHRKTLRKDFKRKQAQRRAAAAQKSRGNSVPGVVFSHTMPKIDFYHSHRFN